MESFEIPTNDEVDCMSADKASEALEKIDAEQMDNESHPLRNSRHPQAERYRSYHSRLWDRKCQDMKVPTVEEGLQEYHETMLRERIKDGERVMAELVQEGFQEETIPDDLPEHTLDGLKVQLQMARRQFSDAAHYLNVSLNRFPSRPAEIDAAMRTFQNAANDDVDAREYSGTTVLHWIMDQFDEQAGVTRESEESA